MCCAVSFAAEPSAPPALAGAGAVLPEPAANTGTAEGPKTDTSVADERLSVRPACLPGGGAEVSGSVCTLCSLHGCMASVSGWQQPHARRACVYMGCCDAACQSAWYCSSSAARVNVGQNTALGTSVNRNEAEERRHLNAQQRDSPRGTDHARRQAARCQRAAAEQRSCAGSRSARSVGTSAAALGHARDKNDAAAPAPLGEDAIAY
jgi:hypothetical protein